MMLSLNNRRGATSSTVSGDDVHESLWERGGKFHHVLVSAAESVRGNLSHPKFLLRSRTRSALWLRGMCWQEAMAIRLELRTAGAMRPSWDGGRSHKSGPSKDASSVVSVEMFFFCK